MTPPTRVVLAAPETDRIDRLEAENRALRARLAELEEAHRRLCDDYVEASDRAGELVLQHAALRQIHGAAGREPLLQALQEIVINVIGSEELAIFEREGDHLRLARAFGVDPAPLEAVRVGAGPIGRAAAGERHVVAWDGPCPDDPRLTGCVPLVWAGAVVGALAWWRMLDHKPALVESDREVVEMLAVHAGQALHRTARAGGP